MKFSFLLFTFLQARPYNKPNYAKPFSFYVEKAGIPCRSPAGTNTGRLYLYVFRHQIDMGGQRYAIRTL